MGLLSKKTIVCEMCGKEFQVRLNFGSVMCKECFNKHMERIEATKGYNDYREALNMERLIRDEDLQQVIDHRYEVLEKYRLNPGITKDELRDASRRYKKLSDEEAEDIVSRALMGRIDKNLGSMGRDFFLLTGFYNVIVDSDDVFAAAYTTSKLSGLSDEVIHCVFFTNDPNVPVLQKLYLAKKGFWDITKSKKGREGVDIEIMSTCDNLVYPVMDLENLKNQIMEDGEVNGNIDYKVMLSYIKDAIKEKGFFDPEKMDDVIDLDILNMLESYGYVLSDDIINLLNLNGIFEGKFWRKHIENLKNKALQEIIDRTNTDEQ